VVQPPFYPIVPYEDGAPLSDAGRPARQRRGTKADRRLPPLATLRPARVPPARGPKRRTVHE